MLSIVPVASRTLAPFTHTNCLVVENGGCVLVIDPGFHGEDGGEALRSVVSAALRGAPHHPICIFLTHHHVDHVEGLLPLIDGLRREGRAVDKVVATAATVARLVKAGVEMQLAGDGDEIIPGCVCVLAPGHTDGHAAVLLSIPEAGISQIYVGDHACGHGSVSLDGDSGGDMTDYLASCQKLIDLCESRAVTTLIPSHGAPSQTPVALLHAYVRNRMEREEAIREALNNGAKTLDDIVKIVYASTPEHLWPAAKRNITLHLKRLAPGEAFV
jgi:glyoxylase-like metal-dependent hydrolase (beta-lactamase superfamily II)